MNEKVVIDTNLLLDDPSIIERYDCVILSHVVRELEKHKLSSNGELAYKARKSTNYIENNIDRIHFDAKDYNPVFDKYADDYYEDNKILQACIDNGYSLASNDMLLKHKAKLYKVKVVDFRIEEEEYLGYKVVEIADEQLAKIYENRTVNTYDVLTNQYLIATHPFGHSEVAFRWDGDQYVDVEDRQVSSIMLGKFKSMDIYQKCALDSIFVNDVTMIRGTQGSGKTLIALSYGLSALDKGKFDRIVMFTGNVPVAGVNGIGYLPGDRAEKLGESGIGNILSSKLGDRNEIYAMMQTGKLEILPISDIRGYDTGDRSLVILTEFQNTSKDIAKLCLGRVGEGSKVIIDGDNNAQVDKQLFAGDNNGMTAVSKSFRGENIYGEIKLKEVRRSKVAQIASRM